MRARPYCDVACFLGLLVEVETSCDTCLPLACGGKRKKQLAESEAEMEVETPQPLLEHETQPDTTPSVKQGKRKRRAAKTFRPCRHLCMKCLRHEIVACCNAMQGHAFEHVCCECVDEAEEALHVADAEIQSIKSTPTPRWGTIKLRGKYVQFETVANIILDNAGNKDQSSVAGNSEVRSEREEQTTLPAEPVI